MTAPRDRIRLGAATVGWLTMLLPLATVLLSVALWPASTWTVRLTLAGFCVLALLRPDAAFLVTTALVGFGLMLAYLADVGPLRVTEVLVVATLAGCCARALGGTRMRAALAGRMSAAVVLFALVAVASTAVWLRVNQFESGYASVFAEKLLQFARRDYFVQPGDFWIVVSTATILEGLALFVVAAALCQLDATFFPRALRMLAVGGAGLAVMSVVRLAEILLRNPHVVEVLRATYGGLRISPQIPDYIAAGSYFSLCWVVALGLAMASSRRGLVWLALGIPLLLGLYLTGSRSVIAAALAGLAVLIVTVIRRKAAAVRVAAVFAVVAGVVMVVSFASVIGRDVAGVNARQSLTIRSELMRAGLHVVATRPWFGVGVDRFDLAARAVASPELNAMWPGRKSPHNDFLRFGAELGLVGLALFLWILGASAGRIWQALRRTGDIQLAGLTGGLVAFLVTSFISNPLMVRDVSYVFWIALGLAVGHSAGLLASPDVPASATSGLSSRLSRFRWPIVAVLGGLVAASVPFRAEREVGAVDVTRVTYGLYERGRGDATQSRWSGPRFTLFVDGRARLIEVPLSGTLPSGAPQQVEVRVDGRVANRIAVGREWQRLRTLLPPDPSTAPRRIDFLVSPTWVPAEVMRRSQDRRDLGVRVGEIKVVMSPDEDR